MSTTAGEAQRRARGQLGAELARVRSLAGLGQREMAARVGLTQSKASRIESGRAVPARTEVTAWLGAAAADLPTRARVEALLDAAHTQVVAWRSAIRTGSTHLQHDVAQLEESATTVRGFASRVVPGLLQTAGYARALFARLVPLDGHDDEAAVAARVRRQEQLYSSKQFTFVVAEAALRWSPGSPSILIAQLDRLATLADLPNIEFAVVPAGREPGPAQHDFTIYLGQPSGEPMPIVNVELLHADMTIDDPDDVDLYQREWARWRDAALTGEQARDLLGRILTER